jgi:hypothetical protein
VVADVEVVVVEEEEEEERLCCRARIRNADGPLKVHS